MANLRRNETVEVVSGSYVAPGSGYFVNAYAAGGMASGPNVGLVIPLYLGHGFQAGDYAMKGISTAAGSIALVASVTTTSITVSTSLTAVAGNVFINIGPDTGGTTPTWIQTSPRVVIYSTPTTATTITNSIVTADSGGNYGYWYDVSSVIWELIRNPAGVPVAYVIQNSNILLTSSSGSTVDNSIARWDGTSGLVIQGGYSSNTPLISDAGAITAAGAHTLGQIGNIVGIAGGLTVAQTLAVTGVTTVAGIIQPNANNTIDLGLTGTRFKDLFLAGGATVAGSGSFGTTLAVAGNATFSADTFVKRIKATGGTAIDTGQYVLAGWGSGATVSSSTGFDQRFTFTVSSGTGPSASGTITITFKDGTWTNAPLAIVAKSGGAGTAVTFSWATTATTLVITHSSTPTASSTYIFTVLALG